MPADMDLVEIREEKLFFGQEFLTWLWFKSEANSGLFDLPRIGSIEVWFIDKMVLEAGRGQARQTVTCQGHHLELVEAKTALREGKKVSQARLKITADSREYTMTIKAEGLDLSAVRAPKSLEADEEEPGGDMGRLLERVAVIQELTRILDGLFRSFLEVRLGTDWERAELPRLRRWLGGEKKENAA